MRRVAAALSPLVMLAACSSSHVDGPGASGTTCPSRTHQVDVAYVADGDPLQQLDLYLPPGDGCDPVPVVVWVHGGGWQIGDKRNNMQDKVALWNGAGWAVASVNYRLTDMGVPAADRVVAPTHNEDVAAALAWLVDQAPSIGLDPNHLALLGHSAGAAIAAAVAVDPAYLAEQSLSPSAIACSAPLDTEGFDISAAVGDPEVVVGGVYRDAFGADPARWAALSPITHVGEAAVPPLFLVTRGTAARRDVVATFARVAREADGEVTVVDLPGFTHADVNDRIGAPGDDVLTPALQAFLTGCLDG